MKLHILSDLHVDLIRRHAFVPANTGADVVVLAGDIHNGTEGITWARMQFPDKEVIYVAGNHEFYGHAWNALLPALRAEALRLGVRFLDNDSLLLGGVRFLGATLWTDFDLYGSTMRQRCMDEAAARMYDYTAVDLRRGREDDSTGALTAKLTPKQTRKWSLNTRRWLLEQLALPFTGSTVVVTHHLPHLRSVAPQFDGNILNGAFASDLRHLFAVPTLWVHGHTHDSMDYVESGVRVVCNPRGYERGGGGWENARFIEDLTVEIM